MKRRTTKQLELPDGKWGGRREGAGRPAKREHVPHLRRTTLKSRFPLHVTLKVRGEVGSLRTERRFQKIKRAFRYGSDRFGMRLAEFSVQGNHIHLIVEAADKRALSRGMQGLAIRVAKGVNRASGRRGKVFADRYHSRVLKTPSEVRNAVHYVRKNWHKHTRDHAWYVDPYSSMSGEARWEAVAQPRTWLLRRTTAPLRGGWPTAPPAGSRRG